MSMPISNRINSLAPPATIATDAKATELKEQGFDVINMGFGEPDFDTPEHIKNAAIFAINNNQTRYPPVAGTLELKTAVMNKLKRENHLDYQSNQILVSCGAKQSLFNALMSLLNPGDEVIIPAPFWVSYPDMVSVCEGIPVTVATTHEQHFKITPEALKQAITPKTKLLILNSPNNPTGMVYSQSELKALADVLLKCPDIIILTDDIYEHIHWADAPYSNIVNAEPKLYDRTVVINGVSKAYAMTGWRIGFSAGPQYIIQAMKKAQSQSTSGACSIAQAAAAAALAGDQSCLIPMVKAYQKRHDVFIEGLNQISGIHCVPAQGAFYIFANVQKAIDQLDHIENDVDFANYLLERAYIAAVPGSAFGAPGHLRFSYACSIEQIKEVLKRIKAIL